MDPTPTTRRWGLRRAWGRSPRLLALGALGVLLVAWVVVWRFSPDKLARYRAALIARGEVLTLRELAPPPSDLARAHARKFEAAAGRLRQGPVHPGSLSL